MFILQLALIGLSLALLPLVYVLRHKAVDKFGKLVWVAVWLTLDLIIFGSFTRLTDSGLGCPDWPGCYGTSSPFIAQAEIQAAQQALPNGPVTLTKAWIEMIHRYLAMTLGVLIVAQVVLAFLKRKTWRIPLAWPLALLGLICLQGAFGAWTVTLKLEPWVVTTHLLLGITLLGALGWLASSRTVISRPDPALIRWQPAALLGLGLLIVQIALGGWVSANYAMLACTDFPTCNGAWLPPMNFARGFEVWRTLGRVPGDELIMQQAMVAIHWTHRTFAMVVFAYLAWLGMQLRHFSALRPLAIGLLIMLAVQFATGLSNIVLKWPLLIALAHNGGAAVLVLLSVGLNYRIAAARRQIT